MNYSKLSYLCSVGEKFPEKARLLGLQLLTLWRDQSGEAVQGLATPPDDQLLPGEILVYVVLCEAPSPSLEDVQRQSVGPRAQLGL